MRKLKIGDKVRITERALSQCYITQIMKEYIGETAIIKDIQSNGVILDITQAPYIWDIDDLDLIEDKYKYLVHSINTKKDSKGRIYDVNRRTYIELDHPINLQDIVDIEKPNDSLVVGFSKFE